MLAFKFLYVLIIGCLIGDQIQAEVCHHDIVQTMPELLTYNKSLSFETIPTHEALISMIDSAESSIKIASMYVTFTSEPEYAHHSSTVPGKQVLEAIVAASKRGVNVEVVLDRSNQRDMSNLEDVKALEAVATVKFLNQKRLGLSGCMHSKFMIVDGKSFYMGSANFDWRAYSQIKEIGIMMKECEVLAGDLEKIFQSYIHLADSKTMPQSLPVEFNTNINMETPTEIQMGNLDAKVFLAGSPPSFSGVSTRTGRTDDIDALLHVIEEAEKKIDISIMNYGASSDFMYPKIYWPLIDNALRKAAVERKVMVRLLVTDWAKAEQKLWYKSLNAIQGFSLKGGGIHVKMFKVPKFDKFQEEVKYARVKHDKFMVTEKSLYIGTSNWSPDYFIGTAGVSMVAEPKVQQSNVEGSIIANMQEMFDRDFESSYAYELE